MTSRPRVDRDYYAVLGVPADADEERIRHAYRQLALRWHPDRNAGDARAAERFKEISEAYAVLIDPRKRAEYDRARAGRAPVDWAPRREDIFRDLFADPRASAVFEELARELTRLGVRVDRRTFHDTLFGGRTVVTGTVVVISPLTILPTLARVMRAAVRGARADAERRPLDAESRPPRETPAVGARPAAGVAGVVRRAARWLLGLPTAGRSTDDIVVPLRVTRAEAVRGGKKRVALGGGREEVLVTIPPGIRAGTRLRLRGKGHAGNEGRRGDAYLAVEIVDGA